MGTVEMLIITGTLIVVVAGGLAIFFWWRMQYGVWSRPSDLSGQGPRRVGTVISDDFDTRQQRIASPVGSDGVPLASSTADAAERLRLIQLGAVAGLVGGAAAAAHATGSAAGRAAGRVDSPDQQGRDGPDDLLTGATEPPLPPDADEPMTRPAESGFREEAKRSSGWSLGSVFGFGGSSDSGSSSSTERTSDSASSSDTGSSYDSGSSDSSSSDSSSSDSGSSDSSSSDSGSSSSGSDS